MLKGIYFLFLFVSIPFKREGLPELNEETLEIFAENGNMCFYSLQTGRTSRTKVRNYIRMAVYGRFLFPSNGKDFQNKLKIFYKN